MTTIDLRVADKIASEASQRRSPLPLGKGPTHVPVRGVNGKYLFSFAPVTKWIRSSEVVWEELGAEALIVSPATGKRWSLNTTAAAVWKACDGSRTLADIARVLASRSGRSVNDEIREIARFCQTLMQIGLICLSGDAPVDLIAMEGIACRSGMAHSPLFVELGLGANARRRPSPRGNSGPG